MNTNTNTTITTKISTPRPDHFALITVSGGTLIEHREVFPGLLLIHDMITRKVTLRFKDRTFLGQFDQLPTTSAFLIGNYILQYQCRDEADRTTQLTITADRGQVMLIRDQRITYYL